MKITRKKNKKLITTLSILAIIILCIGGYFAYKYLNSSPVSQLDKPNNRGAGTSQNSTPTADKNDAPPMDKTPKQFDPPSNPQSIDKSNNIPIVINTITDENTLYVRTTISELLGEGDCKLTLVNKSVSKPITLTSKIINSASSSSCDGWDIKLNTLSSGSWQIRVDITSGSRSGTSLRDINI